MSVTQNAFEIAKRDLRDCYASKGILAGRKHFQQFWARDSFFSALGAIELGDFEIVKKQFEFFISMQNKKGLIPGRISLKKKPEFKPMFFSYSADGNALMIIALAEYVKKSGDKKFAKDNFSKFLLAVNWLESMDSDKDYLIEESIYANWADSVLKFGKVLYSNCCYYKAVKSFSELCLAIGRKEKHELYRKQALKIKEKINGLFWKGDYYFDWIDFKKHNFFSSDGNMLAVLWGIADEEQGMMIENFIKSKQINKVPLSTNYPHYPLTRIPFVLLPFEAYNYHNGLSWPWLGCLNAIALKKIGWKKDAKNELKKIASQIEDYGVCHEIFNKEGEPVDSFFLKSEHPFAWTAGTYIKAFSEIEGIKEQ